MQNNLKARIIGILCLLILMGNVKAQPTLAFRSKENIEIIESPVDTLIASSDTLIGYEIVFPSRVKKLLLDSVNSQVIVLAVANMPEYNILYAYDLREKSVKWQLYSQAYHIKMYDTLIYLYSFRKEFFINSKNGKVLWQNEPASYHIGLSTHDLLLSLYGTSLIKLIRASTGNVIFEDRKMKAHGINDYHVLNDSILLLGMDGLHKFNIFTGEHSHYAMTNAKDLSLRSLGGEVLYNSKAVVLDPAEGTTLLFPHRGECGISSNMIVEGSTVYLADQYSVQKINSNDMTAIWSINLNGKLNGRSNLFDFDSTLLFFNSGNTQRNNLIGTSKIDHQSNPYMMILDKTNGSILSSYEFNEEDMAPYIYINSKYFDVISNEAVFRFNYSGDIEQKLILSGNLHPDRGKTFGLIERQDIKNVYMISDSAIVKENNSFQYITISDKGYCFFTESLNEYSWYDLDDIGLSLLESAKYSILQKVSARTGMLLETWLSDVYFLDKANLKILPLYFPDDFLLKNSFLIGNTSKTIKYYRLSEQE